MKHVLNILWLWPDILNLHGDRGNVMALARICELYDVQTHITRIDRLTDRFDPLAADFILLGSGELAVMPEIVCALERERAALESYANSGGLLLVTGTTGSALALKTTRADGSSFPGIGLMDMTCRERDAILGDDLILLPLPGEKGGDAAQKDTPPQPPIYGIQIQMMDIRLEAGQAPFAEVVYGYGNDGHGSDGAAANGILFTNALGPLLVKNPWLTLTLLNRALNRKYPNQPGAALRFDPDLFKLELASAAAIRTFNETKEPGAGVRMIP